MNMDLKMKDRTVEQVQQGVFLGGRRVNGRDKGG
jgi:hypothetical protein